MRFVPSFGLATLVVLTSLLALPQAAPAQSRATVVYLVRHTEKVDDSTDPPLSRAGPERAALLADMLRDAGLTHVHSTDFERTRNTAAPISTRIGVDVALYDHRDLEGMAERLRTTPGRHLVSGHSNTTPQLVRLLGGEATDIPDHEYDRLYILTLHPNGSVSTVLIRYGGISRP